ncbi:hypothetical protein ACFQU7_00820 [Pseudoroseomonas wenyumeiae]
MRRRAAEVRQHLAAALGTVGRGAAPYADDFSLSRRLERDADARQWAASVIWVPPGAGEPVPMTEIREAAAEAALCRLGAMVAGLDELAQREGLSPIMVTLTLPPQWHPNPKRGGGRGRLTYRRSWRTRRRGGGGKGSGPA